MQKDIVINEVISSTGTPIAEINDAIVILTVVNENTTKFIYKVKNI